VIVTIYDGVSRAHEPEASPLSRIIENLNERFGFTRTEADRLHLDGMWQRIHQNPQDAYLLKAQSMVDDSQSSSVRADAYHVVSPCGPLSASSLGL
jgi:hypothetical protein